MGVSVTLRWSLWVLLLALCPCPLWLSSFLCSLSRSLYLCLAIASCHASSSIVLSSSALIDILHVKDTHSDAPQSLASKSQATLIPVLPCFHWGHLLVCTPDVLVFLLFSLYGLLLYFFWLYDFLDYWPLWPHVSPWWPCLSCLKSLRLVLCCLPCVYTIAFASPHPFYSPMPFTLSVDSLTPVLRHTCRITFRIDVLGWSLTVQLASLMYLKVSCSMCSNQSKFPLHVSLSLSHLCVPPSSFFVPQSLNADSVLPSKSTFTLTMKIYSWFLSCLILLHLYFPTIILTSCKIATHAPMGCSKLITWNSWFTLGAQECCKINIMLLKCTNIGG